MRFERKFIILVISAVIIANSGITSSALNVVEKKSYIDQYTANRTNQCLDLESLLISQGQQSEKFISAIENYNNQYMLRLNDLIQLIEVHNYNLNLINIKAKQLEIKSMYQEILLNYITYYQSLKSIPMNNCQNNSSHYSQALETARINYIRLISTYENYFALVKNDLKTELIKLSKEIKQYNIKNNNG